MSDLIATVAATGLPGDGGGGVVPDGVGPWVGAFSVELVAAERPAVAGGPAGAGRWEVFGAGHPLGGCVGEALRSGGVGDGVLLCLPAECGVGQVGLMLGAARAVLAWPGSCRLVVVQGQRGAAGLAKTLHLEVPAVPVTVVTVPAAGLGGEGAAGLAAAITADVAATAGFSEVSYDESGARRVPLLRPVTGLASGGELPLGPGDVLLASGGGKGITAECALALGRQSGAAVAILGRSDPGRDAGLAAGLRRLEAAGVRYRYVRADVTSPAEVASAVAEVTAGLGPVTAVLHGAGRNEPAPLASLSEDAFRQTLAPKVAGLEAIMAAVDPAALRLLVTFGSIIGRAGLRGQADYATANDWLTGLTARLAADYPHCRCLALEWSVWAGAGMGERLGVLESLAREGISPISVDDGIAILRAVLATPHLPPALVIMGRAGGLPTISLEPRELPLARFIDQPRVHYPGIELVADADLSPASDPYLADHLLDGDLLFPAVLGLEAMAQAGHALTGADHPPAFEDIEFLRPIVVPPDGTTTIRTAALRRGDDAIDVAIRSSDTSFAADHFRATLRYPGPPRPPPPPPRAGGAGGRGPGPAPGGRRRRGTSRSARAGTRARRPRRRRRSASGRPRPRTPSRPR